MSGVNAFLRSDEFDAWLAELKDKAGRARIVHRIRSAEHGNFGDSQPVGKASQKRDIKRAIEIAQALEQE